ncbi:MAG TPA: hypothetical protein VD793_07305 [Gemmatimonadales bacterium]|nr:hypothetical protein [Gemmatimonadales bacterium]
MVVHHCEVLDQDGNVLSRQGRIHLEEDRRAGEEDWHGTLSATDLQQLLAGQFYRVVLDDGRAGEFFVRRNTTAGQELRAVACHGRGPLVRS